MLRYTQLQMATEPANVTGGSRSLPHGSFIKLPCTAQDGGIFYPEAEAEPAQPRSAAQAPAPGLYTPANSRAVLLGPSLPRFLHPDNFLKKKK